MEIKTFRGLDHLFGDKKKKPIQYVIIERSGCWECISHMRKGDYPKITINGNNASISRHICIDKYGSMDGLVTRHKCDNPACINPDHLEKGTNEENMLDKIKRNRKITKENESLLKLKQAKKLSELGIFGKHKWAWGLGNGSALEIKPAKYGIYPAYNFFELAEISQKYGIKYMVVGGKWRTYVGILKRLEDVAEYENVLDSLFNTIVSIECEEG